MAEYTDFETDRLFDIIKDDLRKEISMYVQTPILAVITIGDDEASKVYVNNKRKSSFIIFERFFPSIISIFIPLKD